MNRIIFYLNVKRSPAWLLRVLAILITLSIGNVNFAQITVDDTEPEFETFKAEVVSLRSELTQQVNKNLLNYQVIDLDIQSLDRYVKANPYAAKFSIQIGNQPAIKFNLEAHDMRSFDYRAIHTTGAGEIDQPRLPCFTFKGLVDQDLNQIARITILENQIKGLFQHKGENKFIEPLSRLTAESVPYNYFVVYELNDIVPDPDAYCGVSEMEELQSQLQLPSNGNRMMMECIELELATDADYEWFEMYGANSNMEILTNLNMVEGVYLSTFNMEFVIVFQNVWETSADPYTAAGSPSSDILAEIRAEWNMNNATFMAVDRDLMHMFSAKDHGGLLGSVSGGLPGVCTDPDVAHGFTADRNGAFLTTAHEIGHNFNGVHGDGDMCGGPTASIMCQGEKSLYFSAASITTIQSYIDNNGDCLTECDCELLVDCGLISDVTVACSEDVPSVNLGLPIIIDACGTPVVDSNDDVDLSSTCPGFPTVITRTYTITDGVDNSTECEQTITVVSNNGPTITCPPTAVVSCIADYTVNALDATGTAECGALAFSASGLSLDPGSTADCNGATYTVTYTATDFCGRSAECDQQIAVVNDPPTIVCPANAVIECEDEIMPAMDDVMVTTSCDVNSTVTFSDPVMIGQANCNLTVYQVTYTATDVCGRQASCTQSLTIENEGPSITIPADMTLACDASTDPGPAGGVATASYAGGPVSWSDGSTGNVGSMTATVSGIPVGASVTDVNISVVGDHSFAADLEITLRSPDGTELLLVEDQCSLLDNINVTLDDEGAAFSCVAASSDTGTPDDCSNDYLGGAAIAGTIQPSENALSGFDGESVSGDWVLILGDDAGGDGGCIQEFEVQVSYAVPGDGTGFATATAACDLEVEVTFEDEVDVTVCEGGTILRTWTATDDCGREVSEVQTLTILPALAPVITSCPGPQTVECPEDIVTTPEAVVATLDCGVTAETTVAGPVIDGPEACPGTTYTYTYTVTDECGRIDQCEQVFTIGVNDEPTIDVVPTITVDCFESINPDPNFADVTTACGNGVDFEVTVTDPVLGFGLNCPGETYSVVYTITDACGRSASATQTFVIDNEGPTMECPDNCEVLTCYEGDYEAIIEAWINTVEATSSCSVDLTVFNTYNGVNGICVDNGFTPVTFSATDACGRSVSCESGIFITDTDAPDIYETPEDLLVPCTANTEQIFSDWLADYGGAEAVDACGGPVTWSADTGVNALNCANGPQAIVVTFTATDGCGNSASVVGTFNTKLLPNAVNVAGLIQTEAAEAVASVEVAAYQSSGMTEMDMSTQTGDYHFEELPYEENTEIVPNKDDDYLNGVTTYDLILLQQHILGIQTLNSPYKQIAADANRSGTISTLDLVLLRRLILHVDEELADNTSWRFVDADFVFPNPADPFETDFPEVYTLSGLEEELKDFVAVKIGDLNLDAATNNFSESEDRSGLDNLEVIAEDQKLAAGQDYIVNLSAANFTSINGFQFTLNFDQTAVELLDIESADLADFDNMNYGLSKVEQGAVTISWNTNTAESLASTDALFKVVLRANANVQLSEVLSITSNYTKAEAYQGGALMNVSLNFSDNGTLVTAQSLRLYQNQPNPFKDATMIGFDLPKAGAVDFMIYDLTGKLVYRAQGDYAAGYNQIEVDRSDLPNGGVFYYHINTDEDSASKKMILID